MSWDAPYPEWPLPKPKLTIDEVINQIIAQQQPEVQQEAPQNDVFQVEAQRQADLENFYYQQQAEAQRQAEIENAYYQQQVEAQRQAENAYYQQQVEAQRQQQMVQQAQQTVEQVIAEITQQPPQVAEQTVEEIIKQIQQPQQESMQADAPMPEVKAKPSNAVIDKLANQILGQGTTSQWTGQGMGSAEANARDMGKILASIGITDINQFGLIDKPYDAQVNPNGRGGFVDMQGNPVDPSTVTAEQISGEAGTDTIYTTKTTTKAYGNKETGQEVPMTYSERQTGNAWGGTFEGSGNTGYRVQFTPDGKPLFYTTGASSSDVAFYAPIIAAALTPILGPAASALLGPAASTLATSALTGALVGGGTAALTEGDILKGALLGGAGGALTGYLAGGDLANVSPAEINAASDAASKMADAGLSIPEINNQLEIAGYKPAAIASALEDAANIISAPPVTIPPIETAVQPSITQPVATIETVAAPTVTPSVNEVINAIVAQQPTQQPVENVQVNAPAVTPTPTINEIISAIVNQEPIVTPVPEPTPSNAVITNYPTETVQVTAPSVTPTPTINEIIAAINPPAVTANPYIQPNIEVVGQQAPAQVAPEVVNAVNAAIQANVTSPVETLKVTGQAEKPQTVQEVINAITAATVTTPTPETVITGERQVTKEPEPVTPIVPTLPPATTTPATPATTAPTEEVKPKEEEKKKSWTASELAELARLGLLATTIFGAASQDNGPKQYGIVPVPEDWKSPVYQKDILGTNTTPFAPTDYRNRNLLIGTQWEKFLDPNYGKVPEPIRFNQPSGMSYAQLMGILGNSADTMPSQALTINDVISGIQNQYGQIPTRSMGQKPT